MPSRRGNISALMHPLTWKEVTGRTSPKKKLNQRTISSDALYAHDLLKVVITCDVDELHQLSGVSASRIKKFRSGDGLLTPDEAIAIKDAGPRCTKRDQVKTIDDIRREDALAKQKVKEEADRLNDESGQDN